jgi:hypothetical protein
MSIMLKPSVPMPTATSRRIARLSAIKAPHDSAKPGISARGRPRRGLRGSCFHSATRFSTTVITADAWITCTSFPGTKSASAAPKASALTIEPMSNIT